MAQASGDSGTAERVTGWRPAGPIEHPPLFVWPLKPTAFLKAIFGFPGFLWPWKALYALIALVTWISLIPPLAVMRSFSLAWILRIFCINLALLIVFAGGLHFRLYIQRAQGTAYKYTGRWLATNSSVFLFRNQTFDNLFWNLFSAVPVWTGYEVLLLWAQANEFAPVVTWHAHFAYCVGLLVAIPLFHELHFYATHRLIHWPPIYRLVHSIHHKNVNVGPWSGLAMHPVEHIVYFSGVLVLFLVPSNPIHILFYLTYLGLSPSQGHTGFDKFLLTDGIGLDAESYAHYLHHKYFEVNYTDPVIPLDKWFGTFHDGSAEAQERMMRRRALRRGKPQGTG
jgi:sterol desaturase/sphingolipid hydroxylase (fatty acid hydroxylase superfamily)